MMPCLFSDRTMAPFSTVSGNNNERLVATERRRFSQPVVLAYAFGVSLLLVWPIHGLGAPTASSFSSPRQRAALINARATLARSGAVATTRPFRVQ